MRTQLRTLSLIAASVCLLACDPANAIHVERGADAEDLVLHAFLWPDSVNGGEHLSRIEVAECDSAGRIQRPVWELERARSGWFSHPAAPVRFRYGADSIPGWLTVHAAEALHSGLYAAIAEGNAMNALTRFAVRNDGSIEVLGDDFPRRPPR
jgi:hypothetical protein